MTLFTVRSDKYRRESDEVCTDLNLELRTPRIQKIQLLRGPNTQFYVWRTVMDLSKIYIQKPLRVVT